MLVIQSKLIVPVLFFLSFNSACAEIILEKYKNTDEHTIIIKSIKIDDDIKFSTIVKKINTEKIKLHMHSIQLDSDGGNPTTAMMIGRVIRENNLNTYVAPNGKCVSACIFILISGVIRMPYGDIYVHRPSYTALVTKRSDISIAVSDFKRNASQFVEDMGISDLLTDAILHTPNVGSRKLNVDELAKWEVGGFDAVNEEIIFRDYAKKLNITPDAFIKKYQLNFEYCKHKAILFEQLAIDCILEHDKLIK